MRTPKIMEPPCMLKVSLSNNQALETILKETSIDFNNPSIISTIPQNIESIKDHLGLECLQIILKREWKERLL